MEWFESVERIEDSICLIYLAEITGSHPVYLFARDFVHLNFDYSPNCIFCDAELPDDGVYEFCARWYRKDDDCYFKRNRIWFVIFDGTLYEVAQDEVLFTLFNLRQQLRALPLRE